MLVKTIAQVPDTVFQPALTEINSIDWQQIKDPSRASAKAFATSTAIHVRVHKPPMGRPKPTTIEEWSVITECANHAQNYDRYPRVVETAKWMMQQVQGIAMGRIMIIELAPRGVVALHIDPLDYFVMYSRFHIPFKTNPEVVFNGGPGTDNEHMAYQHLCQLNNRLPHRLENNSDQSRIHLLVDIAVEGGNQIF